MASRREFARAHAPQRDAARDAFDVGDAAEGVQHVAAKRFVLDEGANLVVTAAGQRRVAQRLMKPPTKLAAPHRGAAAVEDGKERHRVGVPADRFGNLKVAARRRVDHDELALALDDDRRDEGHHVDLRLRGVVEKRVGGGEDGRAVLQVPRVERLDREELLEGGFAVLRVEVPRG